MPRVSRPLAELFVGVHPAEIPGFKKGGVKCPMGRDCTAFHLWESKPIFIFLFFFPPLSAQRCSCCLIPRDIAPWQPPGMTKKPPEPSATHSAWCSDLGPETQHQVLQHQCHPCCFTGTVMCPREYFPHCQLQEQQSPSWCPCRGCCEC